ncbi:unnamed protein product [Trifolium pratense]|uniref:Uncharacterized protein n=1 Tax=Trifolium pratense TaxID=57577 RepID=A0ACB0LFE3_TRIPR|nr:unnamed protein product [Trifolium pratense]
MTERRNGVTDKEGVDVGRGTRDFNIAPPIPVSQIEKPISLSQILQC